MRIIFLGSPGAGKGVQAQRLAKKYHLAQVSTGDILRKATRQKTKLGLQTQSYMEKGELVPDEIIIPLIAERLKEKDCAHGFILDGFPRNVTQAEMLTEMLKKMNLSLDTVLNLKVSTEKVIKRLSARIVCQSCEAVYNTEGHLPQVKGICDYCSGPLYRREDDKEETIENRLKVYEKEMIPLVEYYKRKEILVEIKGEGIVEKVFQNICAVVEKGWLKKKQ